jgi:hypothetical protein
MPQRGQAISFEESWVIEAEKRLRSKGWTQADLRREIKGAGKTAISDIFTRKTHQSPLVPKIEKKLGMSPLYRLGLSDLETKIQLAAAEMTDVERAQLYERARVIIEERKG